MFVIRDMISTREVYDYQRKMEFPYCFLVNYENWKQSFLCDMDGEGRKLFRNLYAKVAYKNDKVVGFIQYGNTEIGFDENGAISQDISYPVIRSLYFDKECKEAGVALLQEAVKEWNTKERIYAFFHYFGMSCYARHGKLFESFEWIAEVLQEQGFVVEHENVYYSLELTGQQKEKEIELAWTERTKGDQQSCHFMMEDVWIGECEIHYLKDSDVAYLRWIYVDEKVQNKGIGTRCMEKLCSELRTQGYQKMHTDTAMDNVRAQHYYEKNGFVREGVTRSYYKTSV